MMSVRSSNAPGAQWLRCDLHVHTPFDGEKRFGEDIRSATEAFKKANPKQLAEIAERFIEACRAAAKGRGLDLVSLTDHNSIDGYRYLKPQFESLAQQAKNQDLPMPVILPGVEFTVGGERPIHFLAIFAADTKPDDIDGLIQCVFGARERFDSRSGAPRATGDSVDKFLKDFYEFCRPSNGDRNLHSVLLPAHADGDRGVGKETGANKPTIATGIWEEMRGHLRQWAVSRKDWNGFETARPFAELPQAFQDLLLRWAAARRGEDWDTLSESQKTRYREQRHWALVECSDPYNYETVGTRYTWLKMEVPDVEGIRLALLDPESRLRRMADGPPGLAYPRIERLRIRRTDFFEDLEIPFHPCLTTMIGGRGAGKSTVIEYLRYALDRARQEDFAGDRSEDIRSSVEAFLAPKKARDFGETPGTLLPDHEVEIDVVVAERLYQIRRTREQINVVMEPESLVNAPVPIDIRSLLVPRLLSQRQIARIARDSASQRSEVDALIDPDQLRQVENQRRQLIGSLTQIQATRTRLKERRKTLPARETELQKVRDQIAFLETSGGKETLARFESYQREQHWIDERLREVETLSAALEDQAAAAESTQAGMPEVPSATANEKWLRDVSARLKERLERTITLLRDEAVSLSELVRSVRQEQQEQWQPGFQAAREEYEELRQEMNTRGVNFAQHEKLLQQRVLLEREVRELQGLAQEIDRTQQRIGEMRAELVRLHEHRLNLRQQQAKTLEDLDADVRLDIFAFRDRADFEPRREEWFPGAGLQERDWSILVDHVFAPNGSVPERIGNLVSAIGKDIEKTLELGRVLDSSGSAVVELLGPQLATKLTGHFFRVFQRAERVRPDEIERFLPEDAVEARVRSADGGFKPITTGSVGERSTAILSLLLSAGDQPLIIDQPEDDLDNRYVYDVVVNLLRRRKFLRQIIIATHNANIPVNGDAELIIALGVKDRLGTVLVAGSIERPEVKGQVSVIMEGSVEAFRLRRERYGF